MAGAPVASATAGSRPGAEVDFAEDLAGAALTLARLFATGATLWCVAPAWPAHAHHVAVEFVHPVIMGTRALPAVSVDATSACDTVRVLSRPGDVLLVLSATADPVARHLLARSEAWGLTSLWLGAGPRPVPHDAATPRVDHVVWFETADPARAAGRGDLVLLYHLLWELTHLVFEHPGLLDQASACNEEICITCSDEGRVAEVRTVRADGRVDVLAGGRLEVIDGRLVDEPEPGDLLLVHAGVAVATLDRRETR